MRLGKIGKSIRRTYLGRVSYKFLVTALVFAAVAFYCDRQVAPFVSDFTKLKGQETVTRLVTETVSEVSDEMKLDSSSLFTEKCSDDGKIQTISANAAAVNKLKNLVTDRLCDKLASEVEYDVDIPIGSLFKSEFLSGSGFSLSFNNTVTGSVTSSFRSDLEAVSATQSIHRLYIVVNGTLLIVAGGESEPLETSVEVLVGETVIVGENRSSGNTSSSTYNSQNIGQTGK